MDITVTDPANRQVVLSDRWCRELKDSAPFLLPDDYEKIIETPACLIELTTEHLCYFRSVSWNLTVLLEVVRKEDAWRVVRCFKNPSIDAISPLLKRGKFIPGMAMG